MSTSAEAGPNIRRLWIVVIGLGLLILVAFAVVVTTIASRLGGMATPSAIGDTPIVLPEGARVLDMAAAGDRIVLRIALPDGGERLLFLDARTGEPVGSRALQPAR